MRTNKRLISCHYANSSTINKGGLLPCQETERERERECCPAVEFTVHTNEFSSSTVIKRSYIMRHSLIIIYNARSLAESICWHLTWKPSLGALLLAERLYKTAGRSLSSSARRSLIINPLRSCCCCCWSSAFVAWYPAQKPNEEPPIETR